jgi:DNA-binding beta-propeller fold protein YncE
MIFHSAASPRAIALVLMTLSFAACGGDSNAPNPPPQGKTIYAVDLSNNFALFHSGSPGTVDRKLPITGLLLGDRIVGIDFRPVDGKLYGVGIDSRVYVVDTVTAVASPVGATFTPALDGTHFGMVLDPATDKIRIQSAESGQNLQLDPATGQVVAVDAVLAYGSGPHMGTAPAIAAAAVTTGAGAATYGIDWLLDELVVLSDPASGQVATVGSTGVTTSACAALDVADDGVMYASMTIGGINNLYIMNLSTGAATSLGAIDIVASIQSIAIPAGASASVDRGAMLSPSAPTDRAARRTRIQSREGATASLPKTCS